MSVNIFGDLKKSELPEALKRSLPLSKNEFLVPLGPWAILERPDVIKDMWLWRCRNARYFFFDDRPTLESFTKYLSDGPIVSEHRVLFLVFANNMFIGHLGLSTNQKGSATIDNVLRGVEIECASTLGIMQRAMHAMICWALEFHGISAFDLEVRSDNPRAIEFYERMGFAVTLNSEIEQDGYLIQNASEQNPPIRRLLMKRSIISGPQL